MFKSFDGYHLVEAYHRMRHEQRIIVIFVFSTLMWVMEVVPSWATSVAVIGLMLLFASDSGVKWMCNPEEVGTLLSYKGVMACFADPVIMLFIGGFVLAIAATKTGLDTQLAKVLLKPFGKKCENVLQLPPEGKGCLALDINSISLTQRCKRYVRVLY